MLQLITKKTKIMLATREQNTPLSQEEMKEKFWTQIQNGKVYKKVGAINAFQLQTPTVITTKVKQGTETSQRYETGDYCVINPDGEKYGMSQENFKKRYIQVGNQHPSVLQEYTPMGKVKGFLYTGDTFHYKAPWGSDAKCWKGGMVVTPYPLTESCEIYSISGEEFENTYQEE